VQNCAQIDRKCTLFRPKTPFFAHFCRGEGRLFGRGFLGGFRVQGGARAARARDTFCVTFHASVKRPTHRTVFDLKNRTVALTQHSPGEFYDNKINSIE
jgi:hypothetical protein